MTEQVYRGPAAWVRENSFILILAAAVGVVLIGDRVAQSGVNPADVPAVAQAKPSEAPPADAAQIQQSADTPQADAPEAQQRADTPAQQPADGAAANGGSAQEGTATARPAAGATDNQEPSATTDKADPEATTPPAPDAGQ